MAIIKYLRSENDRLNTALERANARAEAAEAVLSETQRERDEYRAECARLRNQVVALMAQLQEARTEYRVACEDFNELLDKTSDW